MTEEGEEDHLLSKISTTSLIQTEGWVFCLDFEVKTWRGSLWYYSVQETQQSCCATLQGSWNTTGELLGNAKKLPVQPEAQRTVKLPRSPAVGTERVNNCNRICFCTLQVWAPAIYHAKVVYLSLWRMYSGGTYGSPRLLHRGFQLFRGLMLGTAGWSTIARVVSTTIRKPRMKRITGEAKRNGKKWETQETVYINSRVLLLHFTECSPSHTNPTFSNFHIHYIDFCFPPCWCPLARRQNDLSTGKLRVTAPRFTLPRHTSISTALLSSHWWNMNSTDKYGFEGRP